MAVDGSLIFNTKIDTSGLNSDIAKINKAIAQAQSKAQSGQGRQHKLLSSRLINRFRRQKTLQSVKLLPHKKKPNRLKIRQSKPHRQRKRYQNQSSNQPKMLLIRLRVQLSEIPRKSAKAQMILAKALRNQFL